MTRAEHLVWAKKRALEDVDDGHVGLAIASMLSDLGKHEETEPSVMGCAIAAICVATPDQARRWIDGVN
jgi:hypothetical protein